MRQRQIDVALVFMVFPFCVIALPNYIWGVNIPNPEAAQQPYIVRKNLRRYVGFL